LPSARQLVIDHVASSVHNLAPIRSVYEWRGQLYDRTEARAGIHTRTDLVPFIIERLDHEHPYEVPGVFALPIVATSSASQSWIVEQTTPRR
jgi:periplasmic divalent cation tolerance protein